MQNFTIRDIENLTGIKAHTLRIWEQRYDFFKSQRKESKHRFYDNEDLKKLLKIAFLYHNGWKVSKIAVLNDEDINEQIRNTKFVNGNYIHYVSRLIETAIDFDEQQMNQLLNQLNEEVGFENLIIEICYPFLKKIGMLWSTNNIIPAQEHFSSYIIQHRIISEIDKLPMVGSKPEIVLICPEGEFHELPLLYINYLLKKYGWSVIFLGTNIHLKDILYLELKPDIKYLYIHLITNFTGLEANDYFESVCKTFPDKKGHCFRSRY